MSLYLKNYFKKHGESYASYRHHWFGHGGLCCCREFRKLNPDHELVMICADDATNYAKPTLSNALAGNKAPEHIPLGDAEKCQRS